MWRVFQRKIPDPANELSVRNKTFFEKEVKKNQVGHCRWPEQE